MARLTRMLSAVALSILLPASNAGSKSPGAQSTQIGPGAAGATYISLPPLKAHRVRPLVTVIADSAGAETTDFIVPYGVLKDSGVADVRSLSTGPGTIQLFRALKIVADETTSQFDVDVPAGADIVIVPAQLHPESPILKSWLQRQSAHGATIVSICEGARVLAAAGLLKGKRATTHWYAMHDLESTYPETKWIRDRRYVQDGRIISTTGVSASVPISLALVEAIGGHATALRTAQRIGARDWKPTHRTADFGMTLRDYVYAISGLVFFWNHETLANPVVEGEDEISLALRVDAWERSFRTTIVTTHKNRTPIVSRHGLKIIPDAELQAGRARVPVHNGSAMAQLDASLGDMQLRYGSEADHLARLGLEYSMSAPPGP